MESHGGVSVQQQPLVQSDGDVVSRACALHGGLQLPWLARCQHGNSHKPLLSGPSSSDLRYGGGTVYSIMAL